jgi:hypothetical protein
MSKESEGLTGAYHPPKKLNRNCFANEVANVMDRREGEDDAAFITRLQAELVACYNERLIRRMAENHADRLLRDWHSSSNTNRRMLKVFGELRDLLEPFVGLAPQAEYRQKHNTACENESIVSSDSLVFSWNTVHRICQLLLEPWKPQDKERHG